MITRVRDIARISHDCGTKQVRREWPEPSTRLRLRAKAALGSVAGEPPGACPGEAAGSHTFDAKADAEGWLGPRREEVVSGEWQPPVKLERVAPSTMHPHWRIAREAAGRPDLRVHDLRHTGARSEDSLRTQNVRD